MFLLPDTNVLFHTGLVTGRWSQELANLWQTLKSENVPVVLLETVELELARNAEGRRRQILDEIIRAHTTLINYGFQNDIGRRDERIFVRPLAQMLKEQGVEVIHERPRLEDYERAHDRTCKRSAPFPPNWSDQKDPMRDVLIWSAAVRLAHERAGGILLSNDRLFDGRSACEPEVEAGLLILKTPSQAVDFFLERNPATVLIRHLLSLAWPQLREDLPFADELNLSLCIPKAFIRAARGGKHRVIAFIRTKFKDTKNKLEVSANAHFTFSDTVLEKIEFSEVSCTAVELDPSKKVEIGGQIAPGVLLGTPFEANPLGADALTELRQRLRG